jgi:hypothetical protein
VPEVEALDNMQYIIYGIRSGQKTGMAHRKKKREIEEAMQSVWKRTINVCKRR